MSLTRRDFLAGTGGAGAAVAAFGTTRLVDGDDAGSIDSTADAPPFDPDDWDSVRDQFPLTKEFGQFAAYILAAHPRQVGGAINRYRRALDEDTEGAQGEFGGLAEEGRAAAARYLGADDVEVALTESTTVGLGLLYNGLLLRPADEVVTTEHDFYSTHEALRLRAKRDGITVRRAQLYDNPADATAADMVEHLLGEVTPATRAVAITWVHSSTGVKLPIADIADGLAGLNADRDPADRALLCVDGIHGFAVENASVEDLGCDFLVSGTHKWLFGPRGTGVVWGRPAAWARTVPIIPPFNSAAFDAWMNGEEPPDDMPGEMASPGGTHTLEHRWALKEAFAFHEAIGKAAIEERTHAQASALKEGLAAIDGVDVVTPMSADLSAGIVCVDIPGQSPFELLDRLRDEHQIIASTTPYATSYLRFGPSIVTNPDEVEEVVRAVASFV